MLKRLQSRHPQTGMKHTPPKLLASAQSCQAPQVNACCFLLLPNAPLKCLSRPMHFQTMQLCAHLMQVMGACRCGSLLWEPFRSRRHPQRHTSRWMKPSSGSRLHLLRGTIHILVLQPPDEGLLYKSAHLKMSLPQSLSESHLLSRVHLRSGAANAAFRVLWCPKL